MGPGPLSWAAAIRGDGWFYSPGLASWQKKIVLNLRSRLGRSELLWILSSGTSAVDEVKAIGVSVEAVLASAAAVNRHLDSDRRDVWLLNLPTYHVGGLGILARAHVSGARVVAQAKWNAREFCALAQIERVTLISLVPTQVHDLVAAGLRAPPSLRAIVVGGGALDPALYARARALGWPLLPSYGLTECCSQVATAALTSLDQNDFPAFKVLPHSEVELREQRVFVRSDSACSLIARGDRAGQFSLENPLREGWLPTEDLAEWRDEGLRILGRRDDVVKILGTLVSVNQVEHEARAHFRDLGGDLTVLAVGSPREGGRLVLVTDSRASLAEWEIQLNKFNEARPGPFRLGTLAWIPKIPRGELGKVPRKSLCLDLRLA